MTKLTKCEKETILLSSEGEDTWDVFTYNTGLKKRLTKFAKEYPGECSLKSSTKEGAMTFVVSKARLSIRLTAPYSDARRKASSERAKNYKKFFEKSCDNVNCQRALEML